MPERLGQWDLLDRESDPVVADDSVIDDRVSHYRTLADEMQLSAQRLDRIADGSALKGQYADKLRATSGEVASDLHKVVSRYEAVASALTTYRPELDHALAESQGALDDAIAANRSQQAADGMTTEKAADGQELTADQVAANDEKTARTNQAADALSAAKQRLTSTLGALDAAGQAAAATITAGFDDGLKDSGWDRFVYGFMKFLKILIKILTYIAMALAVIALIIPGLGEAILAIGVALAAVDVAANAVLAGTGNGSWADFGIAIAGLLTFGVGKVLGPAIEAALAPITSSIKGGIQTATASVRNALPDIKLPGVGGLGRGADEFDDAIPLLPRSGRTPSPVGDRAATPAGDRPPAGSGVPTGATRVADPDLGAGSSSFLKGESWHLDGVTYTRLKDLLGYRGVGDEGRAAHEEGTIFRDDMQNGHPEADWKGVYLLGDEKSALEQYARPSAWDDLGGHVMEYRHGQEVTVVTPDEGLGAAAAGRQLFGHTDGAVPFMDQLGRDGFILRNKIGVGDDGNDLFEYIVPWSLNNKDPLTHVGSLEPNPFRPGDWEKANWVPARTEETIAEAAGAISSVRQRHGFTTASV